MSKPRTSKPAAARTTVRCAVYARAGVAAAHATNAIRAQRRAAQAFIASRKSQGWVCLVKEYEDVGHSAGTLNRPALRRLLGDIAAGKVDCVVATTLDRLTRSLPDQARLFARLRRHKVMLVTVCPVIFHDLSAKAMEFALSAASGSTSRKRRGGKGVKSKACSVRSVRRPGRLPPSRRTRR
jgi:DNA invertase Pin-like site-specific DNA recombinase